MKRVLLCALPLLLISFAASATDDAAGLRALEIIRAHDIQAHMPGTTEDASEEPTPPPPPEPPPPEKKSLIDLPDWAVETLLWSAVLGGVSIILWSLRDHFPVFRRQRFAPPEGAPEEVATPGRKLEAAQDDADDLANQGRFVEAMHLLLLRSLAEMRQRLNLTFADSLTSREILRQSALPDAASAALTDIIRRVETTYFGRQPADAEDYQACRGGFDTFRKALKSGTAA
jgi:hypothetical protein